MLKITAWAVRVGLVSAGLALALLRPGVRIRVCVRQMETAACGPMADVPIGPRDAAKGPGWAIHDTLRHVVPALGPT